MYRKILKGQVIQVYNENGECVHQSFVVDYNEPTVYEDMDEVELDEDELEDIVEEEHTFPVHLSQPYQNTSIRR